MDRLCHDISLAHRNVYTFRKINCLTPLRFIWNRPLIRTGQGKSITDMMMSTDDLVVEGNSEVEKFTYKDAAEMLDDIQSQLTAMKQKMLKTRVKCKILEVDLATQFNPQLVDVIRSTEKACESCAKSLKKDHQELQLNITEDGDESKPDE